MQVFLTEVAKDDIEGEINQGDLFTEEIAKNPQIS